MIRLAAAVALAACLAAPALAKSLPAPLAAALSAPVEGPLYAYEMRYQAGDIRASGRVDASRPEGERITVCEPPREAWPDGFEAGLEEMDAEANGDIWCSGFAEDVPEDVSRVSETGGVAAYRFQPLPEPGADGADKEGFRNLVAEVDVDTADPAVLGDRMSAPKSFKPAMAARINVFDVAVDCARAPDGRTYERAVDVKVSGSALGRSFDEHTRREITRLLPPAGN